ncbi:MAG: HD domain-containing protein [Nitrososphaerota archaeon]
MYFWWVVVMVDGRGFKLIKDPVHGYLVLDDFLLKIVDSTPLQRLRRITQLPFVYLVYPGARHSRFDHSLGCMHLARLFAESLKLGEHEAKVLTISALVHDIGHTPYSHLLETLLREKGLTHEDLTVKILKENGELAEAIESSNVEVKEIIDVLEKKDPLGSIISGPVDVDKLDFLLRDSYFTGASYGLVDVARIIYRSKIVDGKLALSLKAAGVVEELAIARYQCFVNIYFHHTVRAAQSMFLRGVRMMQDILDFKSMSVDEYLEHDDYTVWCIMKQNEKTKNIVKNIERRILPKVAYESRILREKQYVDLLMNPESISNLEEEIAREAGVPREYVWIDTPYIPPLPFLDQDKIEFYTEEKGEIALVEYHSQLLKFTSEAYKIMRVYTMKDYVEGVEAAVRKVLKDLF